MKTPSPKKQIKEKEGKSETKAKTPINPLDFLGGDSVKRSDRTVAAKRTKEESGTSPVVYDVEMHEDDDFQKTLDMADESKPKKNKK